MAKLTQWGRVIGLVPSKAPPAHVIQKLRDELDNAEIAGSAIFRASVIYEAAIRQRDNYRTFEAQNCKTTPTLADGIKLRNAKHAADTHHDEVKAARSAGNGPAFAPLRDLIDAELAADLAAELYYIAQRKIRDAWRYKSILVDGIRTKLERA
jgi:hypothetical protein